MKEEKGEAIKKILEFFKSIGLYPSSGYGSIIINFQAHKIVNCEKKESIKLSE
jgi:hypothetical protein